MRLRIRVGTKYLSFFFFFLLLGLVFEERGAMGNCLRGSSMLSWLV